MRATSYLGAHVLRVTCGIILLVALATLLPPLGVSHDGVLLVMIVAAILELAPLA